MDYKKLASEGICPTIFSVRIDDQGTVKFRAYFKDFKRGYLYNPLDEGKYPLYDDYPSAEKAMSLAIRKYKKTLKF